MKRMTAKQAKQVLKRVRDYLAAYDAAKAHEHWIAIDNYNFDKNNPAWWQLWDDVKRAAKFKPNYVKWTPYGFYKPNASGMYYVTHRDGFVCLSSFDRATLKFVCDEYVAAFAPIPIPSPFKRKVQQ